MAIAIPKLERKTALMAAGLIVVLAAAPALPAAAAPAPPSVPKPAAVEKPTAAQAPKDAVAPRPRSRANDDARVCLDQPTEVAVVRCAEKYR